MDGPNIFVKIWRSYSTVIIGCTAAAIIIAGIMIGVTLYQKQNSGGGDQGGDAPTPVVFPAIVNYNNGHANYKVVYPIGSMSYKSLKGDLIRFILPAGGPRQIFPNNTQRYTTTADVDVSETINNMTQTYIMPAGSQIQLETSTDDLAVWCTWSSAEHTMWFNANLVQAQYIPPTPTLGDLINMILDGFKEPQSDKPDNLNPSYNDTRGFTHTSKPIY